MCATIERPLRIPWDSLFWAPAESGGSFKDCSNSEAHSRIVGLCDGVANQHRRKRCWRFVAISSSSGVAGRSPIIIFSITAFSLATGTDAYGIKSVRI